MSGTVPSAVSLSLVSKVSSVLAQSGPVLPLLMEFRRLYSELKKDVIGFPNLFPAPMEGIQGAKSDKGKCPDDPSRQ